jgi:small subunit ribosomal protein S17
MLRACQWLAAPAFARTPVALHRSALPAASGLFAATGTDHNWWTFKMENKQRRMTMAGGVPRHQTPRNAIHRVYVKKFRRGAFPNRTRQHWAVVMKGPHQMRPRRLIWPYDITSMLFNQPQQASDCVGYVVSTKQLKTAVVACNHLVYYPKFNQKVARTRRLFAHDEDLACVEGDLVHIRACRHISKYKTYYVFSILEPNIEGRERLKLGLPTVPPPLFGYPSSRRVVKLNLSSEEGTKRKVAAAVQEQLQDFYRFAGRVTDESPSRLEDDGDSFDDVAKMIAPNAPPTNLEAGATAQLEDGSMAGDFDAPETDSRQRRGEETWMKREPAHKYDYSSFVKSA